MRCSARRALELWRDLERETGQRLFEPVGVAWFSSGEGDFTEQSEATLSRLGIATERLTPQEAKRLYPSLGGDDLRSVLFEPEAGVLNAARDHARSRCEPARRDRPTDARRLRPQADAVVWACGSWLPKLFPGLVEQKISRRDVFFFGVDGSWSGTPGFCDYDGPYYGHGELNGLGMKIAPDGPGPRSIPTGSSGSPTRRMEARAREYAARRFPVARRRADRRCARLPVRPHGRHALPRRPASRARRAGGSSAAGRVTASSTARRSPSTSRTASRAAASRSRSTASARARATPASAPRTTDASATDQTRAPAFEPRSPRPLLGPEVRCQLGLCHRIVDPRRDDHELRVLGLVVPHRADDLRRDPDRGARPGLDHLVAELELEPAARRRSRPPPGVLWQWP